MLQFFLPQKHINLIEYLRMDIRLNLTGSFEIIYRIIVLKILMIAKYPAIIIIILFFYRPCKSQIDPICYVV